MRTRKLVVSKREMLGELLVVRVDHEVGVSIGSELGVG